jgi:hypothetical protein
MTQTVAGRSFTLHKTSAGNTTTRHPKTFKFMLPIAKELLLSDAKALLQHLWGNM